MVDGAGVMDSFNIDTINHAHDGVYLLLDFFVKASLAVMFAMIFLALVYFIFNNKD